MHTGAVPSTRTAQGVSMNTALKIIFAVSAVVASSASLACTGYSGPGGPCYTGPGGGLYTGPGGGAYTGPGGGAYTGPGGGCYDRV